jgi:outer membrane protein TolC
VVGVKLSVPLDNTSIRSAREGYGKEAVAAEYNASRKSFEASREWEELVRRVAEVKNRIKLVDKMEELQRKKLDMERKKQKLGRSVLFQVIQYETDLISAQLNIIRTKGELLSLVARMKIFGAEK